MTREQYRDWGIIGYRVRWTPDAHQVVFDNLSRLFVIQLDADYKRPAIADVVSPTNPSYRDDSAACAHGF